MGTVRECDVHSGFPATMTSTGHNTGLNAAADNSNYNYAARLNQYFPMKIVNRSSLHWCGTDPSAHTVYAIRRVINSLGAPCAYGIRGEWPIWRRP